MEIVGKKIKPLPCGEFTQRSFAMLIPAIDTDPRKCTGIPDTHVIKLIAEALQIVSTVLPELLTAAELAAVQHVLVRPTHHHHPYTRWAAECRTHVMWLVRVGSELCAEKLRRWPDNAPHQYSHAYAELLRLLPPAMLALPWPLAETELPTVCTSETSVPRADHRRLIAATARGGGRTRAFQMYYVFTKQRLWRFGGGAETRERRLAKRQMRPHCAVVVPEPWLSFVLSAGERAMLDPSTA